MDEKLIILEAEGIIEEEIDTEDIEQNIEQEEDIEYIEVEDVEEIEIIVEEGTGWVSGDTSKHASLAGRDDKNQHSIEAITGLRDELDKIERPTDHYSAHSGFAEFRQWKTTGSIGRFVSLVTQDEKDLITGGNVFIELCDTEHSDVYGVTVQDSAFCGYQNKDYCMLDSSNDNSASSSFAKVCILGVASVKQGANYHSSGRNAQIGDYVVPGTDGCAVYSESGVGFRVVAVGQLTGASDDRWNYRYVDVALVPQNDNVARVMAELEGTKQNLGNLSIQIGKLEDNINNSITSIIPDLNETIGDLNSAVSDAQNKLDAASDALASAQKISSEASAAIEKANTNYTSAVSDMEAAKTLANNALAGVTKIEKDMTFLKQHEDKIVSFFDEANEDEASLAIMVKQTGDIAVIREKTDKNGAAIEHLVTHADKYSVGERSPSYGLSYEEALGVLGKTGKEERKGYIYVPTVTHEEKETIYSWGNEFVNFEEGKVYVWMCDASGPNDACHRWQESSINVSLGNEPTTQEDGDLWYTWNGVRVDNVWQYEPETLYRWTAYKDGTGDWIAVARANDGNARTMSFINQTAKEISSTVTNLDGRVSEVSQTVDYINSTVLGEDGILTRINQTAEAITLGASSPNSGLSSLEVLLNGMRSVASYSEDVLVGEFGGSPAEGIAKYSTKPVWSKNGFSFGDIPEVTEDSYPMYYFNSGKTTYYCKQIDDDTYKIYTIGNQAMANISTRVDENESAITRLTEFETETGTRLTAVEEKSDVNGASILSIAQMQDVFCAEIKTELTESENEIFANATKYSNEPTWDVNEGKFKFTVESSENGIYCVLDDATKYYKIIDTATGKGYEKYEVLLPSVKYASIEQKVGENSTSIGMVVRDGSIEAGAIISAINRQSAAQIKADKILLSVPSRSTTIFVCTPDTALFSGNQYYFNINDKTYGFTAPINLSAGNTCSFDLDNMTITFNNDGIYRSTTATEINDIENKIELAFTAQSITENQDLDNYIFVEAGKMEQIVSSIGSDGQVTAASIVASINKDVSESKISINADRINIDGVTTFDSMFNSDKTTINGDYIRSGVIESNNYRTSPTALPFSQSGTKIDLVNGIINSPYLSTDLAMVDDNGIIIETAGFRGNVAALSGQIGGFTIKNSCLYNKQKVLKPDNNEVDFSCEEFSIYTTKEQDKYEKTIKYTQAPTWSNGGFVFNNTERFDETEKSRGVFYCMFDDSNACYYKVFYDQNGHIFRGEKHWYDNTGVYIGTNGIGLGHGNFVVDKDGNVTMKGNIVLDGSISWGVDNSPVLVLYSASGSTTPTKDVYDKATDSSTTWHKKYQSSDYYASYSYDGGNEWTTPIKVRGSNGSSASVPSYIKSTYIDQVKIQSPTIYAGQYIVTPDDKSVYDFIIYGDLNTNLVPYLSISTTSLVDNAIPTVIFQGYDGKSLSSQGRAEWDFSVTDFNTQAEFNKDVYIGSFTVDQEEYSALTYDNDMKAFAFYSGATVHFNGATVTGLNIKFG